MNGAAPRVSGPEPRATCRFELPSGADPMLTLAALWQGPGDPQMRFEAAAVARAMRTPAGPAALYMQFSGGRVDVEAWGAGADAALARVPELLGASDDPSLLQPHHRVVRDLQRRLPGLRLTRTAAVLETLIPAVIAQKVTGLEAGRSYRGLMWRFGEQAPGPLGLRLPPSPEELARRPYHEFHTLGLEQRRAETLRSCGRFARQLEEATALPLPVARRRLMAVPGVGEWTAAETARIALGDPDAVSVGDYNVPPMVCWALAGEPRGDDARMLELLEPYRGQRARVVRLLELSGLMPERRGPRLAPRTIAAM